MNDAISPRLHSDLGVKDFGKTQCSVSLRTVSLPSARSPFSPLPGQVNHPVRRGLVKSPLYTVNFASPPSAYPQLE